MSDSARTKRRSRAVAVALSSALSLTLAATPTMAIEEPDYRVVRTIDDVEIRDYPPYVVAEVEVTGSAEDAGGEAFPILLGYISGKNHGERKLPMTAPVTQTAAPVRLPTTAPVAQSASSAGYVVQFVLPKGVTLASAPQPTDPRVRLREVDARRVAAIRYAGLWSAANYTEHLKRLTAVLADLGEKPVGDPIFSRYDAPFTPWFMRRNEIWSVLPDPR